MIASIVAACGLLCAVVVMIVERAASRNEIRKAKKEGYMIGYREATAFQNSHETKLFRK